MSRFNNGCILVFMFNCAIAQYVFGPPTQTNGLATLPCFRGTALVDMVNYQPIGIYSAWYNPYVCLRYCEQVKCKSFVHDSYQKICILYNVKVHESSAYLVSHQCRNYYEHTHWCQVSNRTPVRPVYVYSTVLKSTLPASTSSPTSLSTSMSTTRTIATTKTTTTTSTTTITTEPFVCNSDERVAINGQVGVQANNIPTFETTEYKNFVDCLDRCIQNMGKDGQIINCKAFQYNIASFTCGLFDFQPRTATPNNNLPVAFGNKICLPANAVSLCSKEIPSILTATDKVLIGNVVDEIGSVTFEECVAACFKDTACKSGNYYPTTKECLLKDITRTTNPALYIGEIGTTYFDHDCARSI